MVPETRQSYDAVAVIGEMEQLTEGDRVLIDNGSWSISGTLRSLDRPDQLTRGTDHQLVMEREGPNAGPVEWSIREDMGLTWSATGIAVAGDDAQEWRTQEAVILRLDF